MGHLLEKEKEVNSVDKKDLTAKVPSCGLGGALSVDHQELN
jgi:hypothetical protein